MMAGWKRWEKKLRECEVELHHAGSLLIDFPYLVKKLIVLLYQVVGRYFVLAWEAVCPGLPAFVMASKGVKNEEISKRFRRAVSAMPILSVSPPPSQILPGRRFPCRPTRHRSETRYAMSAFLPKDDRCFAGRTGGKDR